MRNLIWTIPFMFVGCVGDSTSSLFSNREYYEAVSSVLMSIDGRSLVIAADKYHYVFEAPPEVARTLGSSFQKKVVAELGAFFVDKDGKVTGEYWLRLNPEATEADVQAAVAAGYVSNRFGVGTHGELHGLRYEAGGVQIPVGAKSLNQTYKVRVSAALTESQKKQRALLTPLTVAADGTILIASTPLVIAGFSILTVVCTVGSCR